MYQIANFPFFNLTLRLFNLSLAGWFSVALREGKFRDVPKIPIEMQQSSDIDNKLF
jgi:hypothetical protein